MSLLINACQAFDEGAGEIRVSTRADESHVIILFFDNGRGIPAERLYKIFEPNFASKDGRVAMSMGLSLSYNIIRKHAGTIEIDSELGHGTTVSVRLLTTGLQRRGPPPSRGSKVRGGETATPSTSYERTSFCKYSTRRSTSTCSPSMVASPSESFPSRAAVSSC